MNESKGSKKMVHMGLIYDGFIDELDIFQVQVLDTSITAATAEVLARVVRCTFKQKEILKKLKYRIQVPMQCLVKQSEYLVHVKTALPT
ncbi:hypothetical protein [Enterococcus casseliflavus]|uniref:hypothetical protein n=1 Tax=Enterococcus casseliflavus TaxID=37734 RepID=UPI001883A0D1|nr:hypothetical protein [Enterococcus casseliflavus]MBE9909330.1 hypothetical protein [Enterococcus casseliflavus]